MDLRAYVVDSNIFIALYHESDLDHEKAIVAMSELSQNQLIIHPYVIQEVATVLAYKSGLSLAKLFLAEIKHAGNVIVPIVDIHSDMDFFVTLNKKISFVDSSLINLANKMDAPLLTFDKQMIRIAKNKQK